MNEKEKKMHRVKCPVCGYKMPIYYDNRAISKGVTVTCKVFDREEVKKSWLMMAL